MKRQEAGLSWGALAWGAQHSPGAGDGWPEHLEAVGLLESPQEASQLILRLDGDSLGAISLRGVPTDGVGTHCQPLGLHKQEAW